MEPAPTILAELEDYLKREALTVTQFAERSGLHPGTLSNLIHGRRPMAMQQLDPITLAMGLAEGFFYDLYIDNYIIDASPDWRRIGPLLHRCAELDKLDAIQRIVQHIMDNLMYSPLLFDTAEELFAQGFRAAAALLYKVVAEGEKSQHSERLALCRYRLFTIELGDNQDENLRAAIQFEPYVERLDEADQLDALKHLGDVLASLHRWDKVDELAEQLGKKAAIQYQYLSKKCQSQKQPERPHIYYILYGYLMRSAAWNERGDHETALYYASLSSDMSWVKSPVSEAELRVMEQFQEWATANTYLYRLMAGQVEVLPEYVDYVESRENEIFPALLKITQVANHYKINVDDILLRFKSHLSYRAQRSRLGKFNQQVTGDLYACFLTELAIYHLGLERFDTGFEYFIKSLESSIKVGSYSNIVKYMHFLEEYKKEELPEEKQLYTNLVSAMQQIHEEKNGFVAGHR